MFFLFERVFKCNYNCEINKLMHKVSLTPGYGKIPLNKQRYLTPAHVSSCISYVYVDAEVKTSL